jgi:hypothetical protein
MLFYRTDKRKNTISMKEHNKRNIVLNTKLSFSGSVFVLVDEAGRGGGGNVGV